MAAFDISFKGNAVFILNGEGNQHFLSTPTYQVPGKVLGEGRWY